MQGPLHPARTFCVGLPAAASQLAGAAAALLKDQRVELTQMPEPCAPLSSSAGRAGKRPDVTPEGMGTKVQPRLVGHWDSPVVALVASTNRV